MSAKTSFARYLTHPEVIIDPMKSVPEWEACQRLATASRALTALDVRRATWDELLFN
jgi:hypothetical protein